MKNFTPLFALGFFAAAGLQLSAQATFEPSTTEFWTTHRAYAFMGDMMNNDRLDIFYNGQGNNRFNDPVGWWWQMQQNFCINNGDGTFTIDGYDYAERQDTDEEGNPKTVYDGVHPNHGIPCISFGQYAGIDYNNDGLLDLLVYGRTDEWDIMLGEEDKNQKILRLYKNLGDGKFELVTDAAFPQMKCDNDGVNFALSVGDYDRDGYADFAVSATDYQSGEDNYPGRTVNLYRNLNGTGAFQDMKIAETKGGVYTNEVKDDGGNVIAEKKLLEGWFLPVSGNVHLVDINNDGWLDLVCDGWADNNWDGIHGAGNTAKIYLNQNGEKFVDVTTESPAFVTLRSSASSIADFDGDGYLDFFMTGWGDNGYNWNAFLFYNNPDNESAYEEFTPCDQLGLDGTEKCHQLVRDFDGDGYLDIYYSGATGCQIYYGNLTGSFNKGEGMPDYSSGGAAVGDINGNGLSDIFAVGYTQDGAYAKLFLNQGEKVEAPAAPTDVTATIENGKLTITWAYDEETAKADGLAYNIYVKSGDKVFALVPANPETGFVKVGYGRTVALRPTVKSYTMTAPEGDVTVGVQAISLKNETYSAFTSAKTNGIAAVAAEGETLKVTVNGDAVTVNGTEGEVNVYDVTGRQVAAGVAGEAINVAGHGVFVVTAAEATAKIVK